MSGAVLEARAIIRGEDRTKAAFESVKARIAGIASQVATLDKAMGATSGAMRNVNAVQASTGRAVGDMERLIAVTRNVGQVAKAVQPLQQAMGAMAQATNTAQKSALTLSEALRQEESAVRLAHDALSRAGMPVARLAEEQERLARVANATTAAIERQAAAEGQNIQVQRRAAEIAAKTAREEQRARRERDEHIRRHGVVNYLAMGAAGYVGAHSVATGIEESIVAGAHLQHERIGLLNAGRTPEEVKHIEDTSKAVTSRVPTASYLDNLKVIAETTQAFGSVEHATEHLEFMQKAMSVLSSAAGDKIKGGPGEVGQALAKWYEERMRPAEDFQKNASAMIPAMVASGGVFNPEQLYAFAQQAKAAMPSYNDRFMSKIVPSLITANGGERAGTAANAFDNVITGKARDKKQTAEWIRLGLLDPKEVLSGKNGPIGWKAGAVKGTNLAGQDPLEWMETIQLKAMQDHGIDINDRQAVKNELATLYRNQNANFFANEMAQAQSRLRLHKDEHLYDKVGTTDEIYDRNLKSDPTVGIQALKASIDNLLASVSSPAMSTAATAIGKVAEALNALAGAAQNHPLAAMAGGAAAGVGGLGMSGYLGYKMMTGFGLNEAATALTASAGALDAAAGRIGVAGGMPGTAAKAAGAAGGLGAAATGGLLVGGALLAGGSIYALKTFGVQPTGAGAGRVEAPAIKKTDLPGHFVTGRGGVREWVVTQTPPSGRSIGTPSAQHVADYTLGRFDHDFAADAPDSTPVGSFQPVSRRRAEKIAGAGFGAHDDIRVGLDPNSKATIEGNIKIEAGTELLRIVESAMKIIAAGNLMAGAVGTSGSTGKSYPQTAPTGRSGGRIGGI